MRTKLEKAILDSMIQNPNNWNGIFYKNSSDPRVLVPKRKPARGWSFNWASPYSYLSFVLILALTIAAVLFL